MEWMRTAELRLAKRPPYNAARLQQLWVRDGIDQSGRLIFAAEKEWRDVPIVEVDE